ncbi:pilus assembly protein [Cupriavidus sp. BIC8F]|uniref:pilus assembly protein n=1 Tax=Cupriavidus sp. BIC8F TaxID=3079014 RepID=UPI002917094C|nr:PilC/PilY family type IV pilus protein [Cupriavidus sp. BIC8F]
MSALHIRRLISGFLFCCLLIAPGFGRADDIDIFLGSSGGSAAAPHIMILMDNSNNWVSDQPNGKSKFLALSAVLDSIKTPTNVGLATFSYNSPSGAYIRFAPRDISIDANRTALKNLIAQISADANVNKETGNNKDESAGFYEIWKYFSGLKPRAGTLAQNKYADAAGNAGGYAGSTAYGQGLASGWAFKADGTYNSTASDCGKNYIIYIVANNAAGGSMGQRVYEGVDAGPQILPAPSSPDSYAQEWARFLYTNVNPQITTYVLDAYYPDDNQDVGYSKSLQSTAKQGGGSYKHVRNQVEITNELLRIFVEIQAINSTFASASLPVNTTNRTQNKNQVFIPMFRPDPDAKPRWMGNLKQYQVISQGSDVAIGDSSSPPQPAENPLTGFVTDCAVSFWTTDSGTYWQSLNQAGKCPNTSFSKFSDAPDGPIVEKGGVAEVIRKGNNPPTTNATPTWVLNRTVYTQSGSALVPVSTSNSGISDSTLVNFIKGQDVDDENANSDTTEPRPSLHGDSIHSRPLPVDYGGSTGVTTYYGANDGMLRAVDAATGRERWAFIAPEFFPRLKRLRDNSPLINYPSMPSGVTPTPTAKDYFFDGSIGVYQPTDNSKVWIYPTMRRGGRVIYALNVTDPASPAYMWKVGCPNLADDSGCTTGMSGIGQTWSMPKVTTAIKGYTGPVVIVGGGYDACEDANQASPACSSPKGAGVYVLDASTGALIKSFSTTRSVAAEVALLAVETAGVVDHAYAVDTGGNIYRIDFGSQVSTWAINRVAYTEGAGRKFLFPPTLLPAPGNKVYLALGSGDREHPLPNQYPYSAVINRFYIYLDNLGSTTAINLDDANIMVDFTKDTTCATAGILPTSTMRGWFMDLTQNGTGEQTVTSAAISGGMVTFSTNRPIPATQGTCTTALGKAYGYWVNLFNGSGAVGVPGACGGSRATLFVGGGLPPSPVIATVPVDGKVTPVIIGAALRSGGASGHFPAQKIAPTIIPKRRTVYWKSSGEN